MFWLGVSIWMCRSTKLQQYFLRMLQVCWAKIFILLLLLLFIYLFIFADDGIISLPKFKTKTHLIRCIFLCLPLATIWKPLVDSCRFPHLGKTEKPNNVCSRLEPFCFLHQSIKDPPLYSWPHILSLFLLSIVSPLLFPLWLCSSQALLISLLHRPSLFSEPEGLSPSQAVSLHLSPHINIPQSLFLRISRVTLQCAVPSLPPNSPPSL